MQQLGLCKSKSSFQSLKWFPSECCNASKNTLGFPTLLVPQITLLGWVTQHLPGMQTLRVPLRGHSMGLTIPISSQAPGKGSP